MKPNKLLALSGGFVFVVSLLFWPRTIRRSLNANSSVCIEPAMSLRTLFFAATCTITYKTKQKEEAKLKLRQTFSKWPIIVIPTTNEHVFLCLYDNDVDVQLFRIDTQNPFQAIASNRLLSHIVLSSSCKVEEASEDDWDLMTTNLQQMSIKDFTRYSVPDFDFGIWGIYSTPQDNLARMQQHDEIMYPGDVAYPDPHHKGKWIKHPKP